MNNYLSIDTEATGLEETTHLIQLAFVPVSGVTRQVATHLGKETYIQCPSFEELKPNLNEWVVQHNEKLIREAHATGITKENLKIWVSDYLKNPEVKAFFKDERPVLLGKSLSALDIPLLTRYLGKSFMEKHFHHHTLDITCVSRFLVDCKALPKDHQSTTKLLQLFNIRADSNHTALSDAEDMGHVYIKLLDYLEKFKKPE